MKKRVLLIAAIAAGIFTTSNVNAQDFKPAGGEKNIEVNFTPLGGSPISINNLRLRYFKSSDMAFRLGISVSSSSTTGITVDSTAGSNGTNNAEVELENKNSTLSISINPGVEKHFAGTDRLSPYVGAELLFNMVSNKITDEQVVQADPNSTTNFSTEVGEGETTGGSTTFGLNLVIGADWYFSKSIYMGTEVGFGFASTNIADDEVTGAAKNAKTVTTVNGGSFNLGPNFNSAIRVGFLF